MHRRLRLVSSLASMPTLIGCISTIRKIVRAGCGGSKPNHYQDKERCINNASEHFCNLQVLISNSRGCVPPLFLDRLDQPICPKPQQFTSQRHASRLKLYSRGGAHLSRRHYDSRFRHFPDDFRRVALANCFLNFSFDHTRS